MSQSTVEKMESHLDRVAKSVKNFLYVVGIIATVCAAVYITIDRTFEAKVHEVTAALDMRLTAVEVYTADQIERNIIIQAERITQEQSIRQADVEDALRYYPTLKMPTERAKLAYKVVSDYYYQKGE